jgi:L-asparaginase II
VQREVRAAIEDLTGVPLGPDVCGTDGCSIPTWAVPLNRLAHAFAKFGTGRGLAPERAKAAARLRAACAAQPYYVAGTGRFCTEIMKLFGARVLVKTGAEGVYCAALPEQGIGIALKCDDGATRAAEVAMATMIARFLPLSDAESVSLDRFMRPKLRNWNGIEVGGLRPSAELAQRQLGG